jgi:mannose-6-phosphate isomerase-like protein (cupin superfamily)
VSGEVPRIQRPGQAKEYLTAERCRILETWNRPDDSSLSVARARVAPGVTTRWHRLTGICERYLILAGQGWVEVGELAPEAVGPGDLVYIPAECRQRIANRGERDLLFLALCTPRFVPEAYVDIEDAEGSDP